MILATDKGKHTSDRRGYSRVTSSSLQYTIYTSSPTQFEHECGPYPKCVSIFRKPEIYSTTGRGEGVGTELQGNTKVEYYCITLEHMIEFFLSQDCRSNEYSVR